MNGFYRCTNSPETGYSGDENIHLPRGIQHLERLMMVEAERIRNESSQRFREAFTNRFFGEARTAVEELDGAFDFQWSDNDDYGGSSGSSLGTNAQPTLIPGQQQRRNLSAPLLGCRRRAVSDDRLVANDIRNTEGLCASQIGDGVILGSGGSRQTANRAQQQHAHQQENDAQHRFSIAGRSNYPLHSSNIESTGSYNRSGKLPASCESLPREGVISADDIISHRANQLDRSGQQGHEDSLESRQQREGEEGERMYTLALSLDLVAYLLTPDVDGGPTDHNSSSSPDIDNDASPSFFCTRETSSEAILESIHGHNTGAKETIGCSSIHCAMAHPGNDSHLHSHVQLYPRSQANSFKGCCKGIREAGDQHLAPVCCDIFDVPTDNPQPSSLPQLISFSQGNGSFEIAVNGRSSSDRAIAVDDSTDSAAHRGTDSKALAPFEGGSDPAKDPTNNEHTAMTKPHSLEGPSGGSARCQLLQHPQEVRESRLAIPSVGASALQVDRADDVIEALWECVPEETQRQVEAIEERDSLAFTNPCRWSPSRPSTTPVIEEGIGGTTQSLEGAPGLPYFSPCISATSEAEDACASACDAVDVDSIT
ncbi:hypothetical protein, conserved [Eimeria brunetti]|uniref:Uncharacterized protein n=1 Tax=Eimeria brunetti TaxID=51314 RepID=U6LJK0_9EIME|nr:hypothetical protein, conserved [Eimeria brunetti]